MSIMKALGEIKTLFREIEALKARVEALEKKSEEKRGRPKKAA